MNTYPGFNVRQPLSILQLCPQAGLVLAELYPSPFSLLQMVSKVAALNGDLLLSGVGLVQGTTNVLKSDR